MFREVRLDISERTLKSREELERSPKLRTKGVESGPLVGDPSSCGESVGTWESEEEKTKTLEFSQCGSHSTTHKNMKVE